MNRRKFFAFMPLAPVGAMMATAAVAKSPPESLAPEKELLTLKAHKASVTPPTFTNLTHSYVTNPSPYTLTNYNQRFASLEVGKGLKIKAETEFDEETKVSISVGKDGHLWVKINDSWKRVVTE